MSDTDSNGGFTPTLIDPTHIPHTFPTETDPGQSQTTTSDSTVVVGPSSTQNPSSSGTDPVTTIGPTYSNSGSGTPSLSPSSPAPSSDSSSSMTPSSSNSIPPATALPASGSPPANPGSSTPAGVVSGASSHNISGGAVAGAVLGSLLLLGVLAALVLVQRRRARARRSHGLPLSSPPHEPKSPGLRAGAGTAGSAGAAMADRRFSRASGRSAPPLPVPAPHERERRPARSESVGSELAGTYESAGTLAGVDDGLDKELDDGFVYGSAATATTLAHAEPFVPVLPKTAPPASRGHRSGRSPTSPTSPTTPAAIDQAYRPRADPPPRPARSRSREASRGPPSPTTYPPVPVAAPPPPSAAAGDRKKLPRKKPVPRYSSDGTAPPPPVARAGSAHHTPSASRTDSDESIAALDSLGRAAGKPMQHYLIPDMPLQQR